MSDSKHILNGVEVDANSAKWLMSETRCPKCGGELSWIFQQDRLWLQVLWFEGWCDKCKRIKVHVSPSGWKREAI
jgi:hypothetical protein